MSDHSNNAPGNRGRRRRRGGRNRNRSSKESSSTSTPGSYFKPRQKQSGFEKFLSIITFGLLGKPKPRSSGKSEFTAEPKRTPREVGPAAARPQGDAPKREREPRAPRQQPHSTEVTSERLYVGNLSYDASESDLFELFSGSGRVKNAEVVVNNRTQRSKGFAFVTMMTVDDAKKAVADLNNKDFMGRPLVVGGAKPLPEGGERREERVADDDIIRPPAEDSEEEERHNAAV